jgi:hypothetical protein
MQVSRPLSVAHRLNASEGLFTPRAPSDQNVALTVTQRPLTGPYQPETATCRPLTDLIEATKDHIYHGIGKQPLWACCP